MLNTRMKLKRPSKAFAKQTGVSLIEILVTTLVLGVGLLGVAALQVSSVSNNQEALFQSQANLIANDIASRIRSSATVMSIESDPESARTRIVRDVYMSHYVSAGALSCDSEPKQCISTPGNPTSCTLEENADFELYEICKLAEELLPEGKVKITNNLNKMKVEVEWTAAAARKDMGQTHIRSCDGTASEEKACIALEFVP